MALRAIHEATGHKVVLTALSRALAHAVDYNIEKAIEPLIPEDQR